MRGVKEADERPNVILDCPVRRGPQFQPSTMLLRNRFWWAAGRGRAVRLPICGLAPREFWFNCRQPLPFLSAFVISVPDRLGRGTPSPAFLELSATVAIGAPNAVIASRLPSFHLTTVGVVPWRPSRLQEIPAIRLVGDPCAASSGAEGIRPQQETRNLNVPLPTRCAEGRQLATLDRSGQCSE